MYYCVTSQHAVLKREIIAHGPYCYTLHTRCFSTVVFVNGFLRYGSDTICCM